jgi:hypothetical protein
VAASNALLDRGFGRPMQNVDLRVLMEKKMSELTVAELDELERHLEGIDDARWHGRLNAPTWRRNAASSFRHRDRTGVALTDDASSQEGTRWPVETAVNASAV